MKVDFLKQTIDLKLIILPVVYILIGVIVFEIIKKLFLRAANRKGVLKAAQRQRIQTLSTVVLNIIKCSVFYIVLNYVC